jgi:hypothetical protein
MRFPALVIVATLTACAAPEPAGAPPRQPVELAGRTAGPVVRCVPIEQNEALRVSDNDSHTILYGSGRRIWANRVGCGFARDDVLISEPIGSNYCRGDIIRSMDRFTRIPGPACVLGDFVPYNRG